MTNQRNVITELMTGQELAKLKLRVVGHSFTEMSDKEICELFEQATEFLRDLPPTDTVAVTKFTVDAMTLQSVALNRMFATDDPLDQKYAIRVNTYNPKNLKAAREVAHAYSCQFKIIPVEEFSQGAYINLEHYHLSNPEVNELYTMLKSELAEFAARFELVPAALYFKE